jgi:pyrroline-5-carboxylate reductase
MMAPVLAQIRSAVTADHLVVSVAAGVSIATIAKGLGLDRRIARVMPNTPALIGEGAAAYCLGPGTKPEDETVVAECLRSVGKAFRVPESQLDAVTGLSGSGPAFVFLMIDALADGGVRVGLPREVALELAAQTVSGAARMVLETGEHPGRLKDQVASPAGTTIAGLHALERAGVRGALMDAVEAAYRRSVELAILAAKAEESG